MVCQYKVPGYSRSGTYRCSARGYHQQPTHTLGCKGLKSWGGDGDLRAWAPEVDAAAVALYLQAIYEYMHKAQ